MSERSKWTIRYDVVRRLPGAEHQSVCAYPEDQRGFATIGEANEVLKLLKQADGELGAKLHNYEVWPMAVHEEHGVMMFGVDGSDDSDGDNEHS